MPTLSNSQYRAAHENSELALSRGVDAVLCIDLDQRPMSREGRVREDKFVFVVSRNMPKHNGRFTFRPDTCWSPELERSPL